MNWYFYPRPPRGGRHSQAGKGPHPQPISIHALREEGDPLLAPNCVIFRISIHALREEGDIPTALKEHRVDDFYPRPPRGGRRCISFRVGFGSKYFYPRPPRGGRLTYQVYAIKKLRYFYPRPPRGGRPRSSSGNSHLVVISIHALREEGDAMTSARHTDAGKFLSTPSARRATTAAPERLTRV